ncbi:hypothetical protein N6L24_10050 [Cognatishimia sp. SS12]|uniref:hypothetical protein n=1 Tax=Cognatishimia sp. SS12 TaxID=2979465 RepID=UPI00232BB348|nr:hypothetical protein [Cognatishimia sp. SS12]MDC0738624.1 hypothetical protein [Cognatishimia sp. SS12]
MLTSRFALAAALGTTAATAQAETSGTTTDAWTLLEQIKVTEIITETSYEVKKSYPGDLQELGRDIEISGYAVPMYPGSEITELLLVSDMGLCPLCGNSEHGANLQIVLAEPITQLDETKRIVLRGDLAPVLDPETWQAAIMRNAKIILQ